MKTNIVIISILFSLCFVNCNKKSQNEETLKLKELPSVLNYLTALTTPVDIQFNLESSTSMFIQGNNTTTQFLKGTATNQNGNTLNVGPFILNNIEIFPVNNYYQKEFITPQNFYGQTLITKTNAVLSPFATGYQFTDTLYVPNEIIIDQNTINNDLANNKIFVDKNIKWQADLNNNRGGVIIVVEYFPQDVLNLQIAQTNQVYKRNGIVVPDNGSVNIDASLLSEMPRGAYLLVTFVRANYKKGITSGLKSYLVAAYNQKYLNFKYL